MLKERILKEIYEWTYAIIIAIALAMLIHIFLVQPTRVSGASMDPTLHNGEYLLVSKVGHVFRQEPDYGDIVIIDSRTDYKRSWADDFADPMKNYLAIFNSKFEIKNIWVKRVIGKANDTLSFENGKVIRNGVILEENYTKEPMIFEQKEPITVPEGYVFVMGDNRNHSSDSRFIGPVPVENVLGTVLF